MESMLRDSCHAVSAATSPRDLFVSLQRVSHGLGFGLFSGAAVIDHFVGDPARFATITNTPAAYEDVYADAALSRLDPVMQHCKATSVPIVWDQATYVKAGQADLWEQMAQHGYHCGVTMALHLPQGRHFVVGVDRDQALPADPAEVMRIVSSLAMFAVYAQSAFMAVLLSDAPGDERPALSAR
jgi:hypothetical protein